MLPNRLKLVGPIFDNWHWFVGTKIFNSELECVKQSTRNKFKIKIKIKPKQQKTYK